MAEEVPVSATPKQQLGAFEIHPKVAIYTIVIVLVQTLISTAKAHGWVDLSLDATTLSTSLGALAAYYVPGGQS